MCPALPWKANGTRNIAELTPRATTIFPIQKGGGVSRHCPGGTLPEGGSVSITTSGCGKPTVQPRKCGVPVLLVLFLFLFLDFQPFFEEENEGRGRGGT